MTWQEAIARNGRGVATRETVRQGQPVTWRRYADGSADYTFRGQVHDARPEQVEGFEDWE